MKERVETKQKAPSVFHALIPPPPNKSVGERNLTSSNIPRTKPSNSKKYNIDERAQAISAAVVSSEAVISLSIGNPSVKITVTPDENSSILTQLLAEAFSAS